MGRTCAWTALDFHCQALKSEGTPPCNIHESDQKTKISMVKMLRAGFKRQLQPGCYDALLTVLYCPQVDYQEIAE